MYETPAETDTCPPSYEGQRQGAALAKLSWYDVLGDVKQ